QRALPSSSRVGRKAMQFELVAVLAQPARAVLGKTMARRVVDDQEHLAPVVAANEQTEELPEGLAVEHRRELERELRVVERDGAEHVARLAQTVGVDARLHANARPRTVQAAVLPEARLVLEDNYTAAASGLFLIA